MSFCFLEIAFWEESQSPFGGIKSTNHAFWVFFRAITLSKNSQFWVRQGDVEKLIAQGYLQKLS